VDVTGKRKLQNKELDNLQSSTNITRIIKSMRMKLTGQVVTMVDIRNVYKILDGSAESKRALARPKRRWEDHIKWIRVAQEMVQWRSLTNAVVKL